MTAPIVAPPVAPAPPGAPTPPAASAPPGAPAPPAAPAPPVMAATSAAAAAVMPATSVAAPAVAPAPPGTPAPAAAAVSAEPRRVIELPAPIELPKPAGVLEPAATSAAQIAPMALVATQQTTGDRIWRWAAGAAALVCVAVPAVRASGVLAFLCLTAAVMLAAYALLGGRSWGPVLFSALVIIPGPFMGAQWLVTHRPRTGRVAGATVGRVLGAVAVALTLVAVLIPLLRSADPNFAELIDSWTRYLPRLDGRSVVGAMLLAVIGITAAYYAYRGPMPGWSIVEGNRARAGLEWLIPIVVVNLIFAVFVVVQVRVLFGGHEYVLGPDGPDYADYARGGFGQLCVVTMISLGLAAGLGGLVRRDTPRQRVMIRIMGGLLCGLTLVIVASALRRMILYVDVYGFTWLRILSFSAELFLGLVFVLLLVAGARLRGGWLPRATAAVAVAVLLALVGLNPEAIMARTSIDARLDSDRTVDVSYLDGLSADAIDEILRLPSGVRDCALERLRRDLASPDPWYELNLAREHARAVLAGVRTVPCAFDTSARLS